MYDIYSDLIKCDELGDGTFFKLLFAVICAIFLIVFIIKKKKVYFDAVFILFFIYLNILFSLLFLPIPVSKRGLESIRMIQGNAPKINLIPFYDIAKEIRHAWMGFEITAAKNILGNIIAFMPFGFLIPCLAQSFTKFKKFVWLALFVPVGVELIQFIVSLAMQANWRTADIDDVILNMAGMLLGFFVLKLFLRITEQKAKIDVLKLISGGRASMRIV